MQTKSCRVCDMHLKAFSYNTTKLLMPHAHMCACIMYECMYISIVLCCSIRSGLVAYTTHNTYQMHHLKISKFQWLNLREQLDDMHSLYVTKCI